MNTTDLAKGVRMAKIYAYLIRRQPRKFSVKDVQNFLEQSDRVSLRNVQRDLKDLAEITDSCVRSDQSEGKLHYFIEPDMRRNLTLPIQRNGLLAFFLLKRLQPFFQAQTKILEEITGAVFSGASKSDYDFFEDLDEKLEKATYLLGEQSPLAIEANLFNDLMTSLVKRQKLKVLYRRGDSEKPMEKIICPAKLFLFKGELYFVCQSEKHDFFLKICRILKAELLEETFIADSKRFKSIEKRLAASFGILDETESKPRKVVVRFPDNPYYRLIFSEKKFHHSQRISTGKKGELLLIMEAPIGLDLVNWVLAWPEGEVVGPEELREKLREVAEGLRERYGM